MDFRYSTSENFHKVEKFDQNCNSGATQLDVLLQELLNERKATKERDVSSSLDTYKIIEPSRKEQTTIDLSDLGHMSKSHEKVKENVISLNKETRSIQKKQYEYRSTNDSTMQMSSSNIAQSGVMAVPMQTQLITSNYSGNTSPMPRTQVTTTVRTYTYELPMSRSGSAYLVNDSNEELSKNQIEYRNLKNINANRNSPLKTFEKKQVDEVDFSELKEVIFDNKGNQELHYEKEMRSFSPSNPQYSSEYKDKNQTSWKYTFKSNNNNLSSIKDINNVDNYPASNILSLPSNISENNLEMKKVEKPLHYVKIQSANEEIKTLDKNGSDGPINLSSQRIPSVNKAGSAVYYPPNQISKREIATNYSSQGQGRYAKYSGKYEHEYGYKEKSKSSSGGAVIPVCLPLCCAMPCSIM